MKALSLQFISHCISKLTKIRVIWFKNLLIKLFIRYYRIDLTEYQHQNVEKYIHFNDFFTRELAPNARNKQPKPNHIICPVDGFISQMNNIIDDKLLQAKNFEYTLEDLLGGDKQHSALFKHGKFITLYLAPQNYHRIHMPISANLEQMIYIPGQLFSVNPWAVKCIKQLFCKNERVICLFSTTFGPMAMILVGACLVGSIVTRWQGEVNQNHPSQKNIWNYSQNEIHLLQHEEMGKFQYGSTVILLLPKNTIHWETELSIGQPIKLGTILAEIDPRAYERSHADKAEATVDAGVSSSSST